jgi:hypothetical protein
MILLETADDTADLRSQSVLCFPVYSLTKPRSHNSVTPDPRGGKTHIEMSRVEPYASDSSPGHLLHSLGSHSPARIDMESKNHGEPCVSNGILES